MRNRVKITPNQLFYIISIAGIIAFLLFALFNNSVATFDWLVMQHNSDYTFADYFYHIFYGYDLTKVYNSYDVDPCFPPLTYLLYNYMYRICPVEGMERLKDVVFYPYYLFIYMIFASLLISLFSFSVQIFNESTEFPWKTTKSMLLVIVAIMSVPFGASALERGNAVFIVLILLIFALAFKDSENMVLRELALVLIAVAANFKLYPAIIGLLYLKEKRYKEAVRLVAYGVVLFIVPFFFMEGFKSIKEYLIILKLMQGRSCEQTTTVRGLVTVIVEFVKGPDGKWIGHSIGKVVENIYLLLALLAFWVSKSKWKEMFLLVSPMVVYVASAYRYTAIYFFLALLIFMKKNHADEMTGQNDVDKLRYIYSILFALLFTIPVWTYGLELENFMYLIIYVMIIMLVIESMTDYIKVKRVN